VPELFETCQKALEHPELTNIKLAFLTNEGSPQFPNIPNFKQILSEKPYPKLKFTNTEDSKKQVAAILFSSGTTGIPKGVMLSPFNLIANMQQIENVLDPYYQPRATFVTVLPFYHLYAMMTDMLLIMHSACSTNVMKKFDFQTVRQNFIMISTYY
jgi:long-subunit acyl-CoA synthetase (AMP-forming)